MVRRFAVFLLIFQTTLFLLHFFLFKTLLAAFAFLGSSVYWLLASALAILAFTFLSTSLLAFRSRAAVVRFLYIPAAVWLGLFNYLFLASIAWWLVAAIIFLFHFSFSATIPAVLLFGAALATGIYGLVNAAIPRVKHVTISLQNLPPAWHGRSFALVSDLHLGHVHKRRFAARIVHLIRAENPHFAVIAGDLFDGTAIDAEHATAPFRDLVLPFGAFFSEGNHEEFRDPRPLLSAITKAGIRILDKKIVDLDGLQLLGVPYRDATHAEHFRSVLAGMKIDTTRASILICHAPDRPAVTEEAGVSLQVSGHTHGGQIFPQTWFATRIYRQFAHGLSRIGNLQVYTSYGVGTWGPPLRVGTYPELVIIHLQ